MGCVGPKSLISVRNEDTFLDLTVQQIEVLCNVHVTCTLYMYITCIHAYRKCSTSLLTYDNML